VGSFWVDMTRSTLYVLLPLSLILSLALVSQGVVQNFSPYAKAELVQPYEYEVAKTGPDGQPVKDAQGNPAMEKDRRHPADHRRGPGRQPDRHQAARHQRGRLLQRQLRAPASRTRRPCPTSWRSWLS
jgi:hypothetical protein